MDAEWRHDIPPNEVMVEVELGTAIICAMAFYGRDGVRPHWRLPDGTQYAGYAFRRWRPIAQVAVSQRRVLKLRNTIEERQL